MQGQTAGDGAGGDGREAGRVDHRQVGIMFAATFRDLPSVDLSRQPNVGDQHVGDQAPAPCQRFFSVGCVDHLVPILAQRLDDEFSDERVVLDHQYSHRRLLNALRSDTNLERPNRRAVPARKSLASNATGLASGRVGFMARKLKIFETSLGFYDLAIAAPSMKAALEAWGADSNLFHQGVAKESHDPDVVAATMSKPGVVLRRPVGSDGPFKEHADLPTDLARDEPQRRPKRLRAKPKKRASPPVDDTAAHKAALAFEKEQKRRESERRKEEAAKQKERDRRQRAVAKAQAAFDEAKREHDERAAAIEVEREAVESKAQAEEALWQKQKEKLEAALRRARE